MREFVCLNTVCPLYFIVCPDDGSGEPRCEECGNAMARCDDPPAGAIHREEVYRVS